MPVSTASITGIQYYNGNIYALCRDLDRNAKRRVIVFDSETYKEVNKWAVPGCYFVRNLAVVNDKVYVTDLYNNRLCVYSLTGSRVPMVQHSTFVAPGFLNTCTQDSAIISDRRGNKVYRLDTKEHKVIWTCALIKRPLSLCCDSNGDVWVWSETTNSIFLLSSESG